MALSLANINCSKNNSDIEYLFVTSSSFSSNGHNRLYIIYCLFITSSSHSLHDHILSPVLVHQMVVAGYILFIYYF